MSHNRPYVISSEDGAQQGDPIGPLLFSNTLQPVLSSLQAHLNLGYLDDVTLGGPVEMVASDVAEIVNAGFKIGLSLNAAKCELIGHPDLVVNDTRTSRNKHHHSTGSATFARFCSRPCMGQAMRRTR